jgi:polyisoprenoid-binding protein YceI
MESSKYPKATFVGNIQDFKYEELTNTENNYDIVGVLAIRGIEKSVTISGRMQKTEQGISLKTNFIILTEDYNIKIPKVVRNKISKKINIKVEYELIEKI